MENYAHGEFEGSIDNMIHSKNLKFDKIKIKDNKYLPKNYKYWQ